MKITREQAAKVLELVNKGLVSGIGKQEPGKMCVEAVVCYAFGEPHGDKPTCVAPAVNRFKVRLNDARWPSNEARTDGMRKLAIAQLGSAGVIDERKFSEYVAVETVKRILPMVPESRWPEHAKARREVTTLAGAESAARNARKAVYAAAAAYAADAAAHAAAHAAAYDDAAAIPILSESAQIGLEALQLCGSPGCEYLDLVEASS